MCSRILMFLSKRTHSVFKDITFGVNHLASSDRLDFICAIWELNSQDSLYALNQYPLNKNKLEKMKTDIYFLILFL